MANKLSGAEAVVQEPLFFLISLIYPRAGFLPRAERAPAAPAAAPAGGLALRWSFREVSQTAAKAARRGRPEVLTHPNVLAGLKEDDEECEDEATEVGKLEDSHEPLARWKRWKRRMTWTFGPWIGRRCPLRLTRSGLLRRAKLIAAFPGGQ